MIELPGLGSISPYWLGVLGSAAVEIFAAAKASADMDGGMPSRYKKPFYLLTRVLVALASGVLPVVFGAPTPLAAFYLGLSAPLVIDRLAQGVLPKPLPEQPPLTPLPAGEPAT
jgi:hypothetical protein